MLRKRGVKVDFKDFDGIIGRMELLFFRMEKIVGSLVRGREGLLRV